ncbi:MAG: HAD family hydrolase [Anaerolineae bacterium]|nr:Cof-type HAD-IIB family hydrolase [Caldilineales bacterium]MDW8268742.1 HAD family hydrolase [Anaerolineae bacterium]
MSPIRLLACDLDGTLADRDGRIGDATVAALARARRRGILTVLATGRLPFALPPFLDRLGITTEPFIAAQGALIGYRDGRLLRRLALATDVARAAAVVAHRLGAGMAYFHEDEILIDRYVFPPEQYEVWFGHHGRLVPDAVERLDGRLIKFMAIHPQVEVVPDLVTALRTELGGRAEVVRSWHHFVEGTTPGADKGAALAWLCARLGIGRDEVLAIGDGGNDVTMLRWAAYSAAPADADPAALAVAGWVAPPLDAQPVAAALAHFLGIDGG